MTDIFSNIEQIALILMKKHMGPNYIDWTFKFNHGKRILALCNNSTKTICFSKHFAKILSWHEIVQTILHEIAHALTPGQGHNMQWKNKCIEIGCNPDRLYHGPAKVEGNYMAVCNDCGKKHTKHRMSKNKIYRCRCGSEKNLLWSKTKGTKVPF